jgi:hypothetical protein
MRFVPLCLAVAICVTFSPAAAQTIEVSGAVQPPPGHTLQIDVDNGRWTGLIKPDGTFRFPVKGQPKETVNVVIRDGAKPPLYNNTQTLGTTWEMQIGPLDPPAPTDSVVIQAVAWSVFFSIIAGFVELQFRSKADLRSCFAWSSFLYIVLLAFFNTLAAAIAATLLNGKLPGGPSLTPVFFALFGVFAFQTVLSNTNITIFEKGVLEFQEWTGKARDPAVTVVQQRQVQRVSNRATDLANQVMKIDDGKLTTLVLDAFGQDAGEKLLQDSENYRAKYHADAKLYLALAFARTFPDRTASAIRRESSKDG